MSRDPVVLGVDPGPGTHRPPPRLPGERNPGAKLAAADVAAIRTALAAGVTGRALAAEYGVSPSAISLIRTGRKWTS